MYRNRPHLRWKADRSQRVHRVQVARRASRDRQPVVERGAEAQRRQERNLGAGRRLCPADRRENEDRDTDADDASNAHLHVYADAASPRPIAART